MPRNHWTGFLLYARFGRVISSSPFLTGRILPERLRKGDAQLCHANKLRVACVVLPFVDRFGVRPAARIVQSEYALWWRSTPPQKEDIRNSDAAALLRAVSLGGDLHTFESLRLYEGTASGRCFWRSVVDHCLFRQNSPVDRFDTNKVGAFGNRVH